MTAPGQEPDEVMTATPGGKDAATDEPDLGAIGDNHMPEDVREAERRAAEQQREDAADDTEAD